MHVCFSGVGVWGVIREEMPKENRLYAPQRPWWVPRPTPAVHTHIPLHSP